MNFQIVFYLLFLLLLPLISFSRVLLISNYPLPKNNIPDVLNEENYLKIVEILKSLDGIKDVSLEERNGDIIIRVERYPILKEVAIRGNRAFWKEEILSYLTLYEGVALKETDAQVIENKLKEFYRGRGFLETQVKVKLTIDELGFARIYIEITEGDVFFLGGGIYKGSSLDATLLDEKLGLIKGKVAKEEELSKKMFDLQEIYLNLGFWDSHVYYEGLQKVSMDKPFLSVLMPMDPKVKKSPLKVVGALAEGLKNLFSHPTGTLKALVGRGKLAYPVFSVFEGKRYEVFFEGNRLFNSEELLDISGLKERGVGLLSLEEAKDKIINAYHSKGFFDVEVGYRLDGEKVYFYIRENRRYKAVINGEYIDYDEELLKKRLEKMLADLKGQGYTLSEGSIKKDLDREKGLVRVSFEISKGKKQILKKIAYTGDDKEIKKMFQEINRGLPTVYDSSIIEQLNAKLGRYLEGNGYMEWTYDVDVILEEDEDRVFYSYLYKVIKGPRYRLGLDLYYGANITNRREISYMTVREEFYTERALDETFYNFMKSDSFVGVRIDTFLDKDKKQVHRLIQLQEDKRGFYDFGLGYNTQEGLILDLSAGLKNLFGVGLMATANYKLTGKRETYSLNFEDRFLFTRRLWFRSSIFRDYQEHKSYNLKSEGFALGLGYRITRWTSVGPILSITNNRFLANNAIVGKYGLFLLREYKDDIFNPKRIHYNSLSFLKAYGDLSYSKFELSTFYLIPIISSLNFSFKISVGTAQGKVPIFDRYFLGGFRDLRGYSFEEIGQPNGGKSFTFGRFELELPLKGSFLLVPFYDVGGVDPSRVIPRDIKHSFGFGAGVRTPIGPVRLDLAFPGEGDFLKKPKIYLSVGYVY